MQPQIEAFFDPATSTISYIVFDEPGGACAIIDPVLDYNYRSGRTSAQFIEKLLAFVKGRGLTVEWILETHIHADHLSSAHYLKSSVGGKTGAGRDIPKVQQIFKEIFHLGPDFIADGRHFDALLGDGEAFSVGKLSAKAISTPGHTPADLSYRFGDAIFVGDTLFMPDLGTARADFPGGDARQLFQSIRKLLGQPGETRLFLCHDYPPPSRQPRWETTVAEQRAHNIHVGDGISEKEFIAMREARDATLDMPLLMFPSVQVNVRAGEMPPAEENGVSYLKIPLNLM